MSVITVDATFLKIILIVSLTTKYSLCTIGGLTYMDPLNNKPLSEIPGSNPCNPLYWYPKSIPEYCYFSTPKPSKPNFGPLPMPIPVPVPQPVPVPAPMHVPAPVVAPLPPVPAVPMPSVPLPYGLPIAPLNPMLPVAGAFPQVPPVYYPYPRMSPYPQMPQPYHGSSQLQVGMVPGIPGLVSEDGGINVLPFSDVYSDILEKHKNKILRKRLQEVIRDYEDYPRVRYSRRKMHRRRMSD